MKKLFIYLFLAVFIMACSEEPVMMDSTTKSQEIHPRFQKIEMKDPNFVMAHKKSSSPHQFMTDINAALQAQGVSLQLSQMDYYGADGAGNTVFFNNRGNKQLSQDFVPGDLRRGGFTDIAYARDGTEGATTSGLSQGDTDGAILTAMDTWDNVTCSGGLNLANLGASPFDLGYVQWLIGAGGTPVFTDIMHSGFNTLLFDLIFGAGSNVLGVTFTFIWVDGGVPTDVDNNGKIDVAFRDIYYNDAFSWAIGPGGIDVETVALHEAGHGLSQGHFGKLFLSNGNGNFHFAPRAVMNAGYTGIQRSIDGTDKAGHCSNWGQWPNN